MRWTAPAAGCIDLAGGPAPALHGIAVDTGDRVLWTVARARGSVEWFAGVDRTVTLVPEPATSVLALLGLATRAARARLRAPT